MYKLTLLLLFFVAMTKADPAPDFSLPLLDESAAMTSLTDYRGKIIYLGFLGSTSGADSVYNSSGDYGDDSSETSINNAASTWGSASSEFSANNSTADTPPLIIKAGRVMGRFTTNTGHQDAIAPSFADSCTFSALTGKAWTNPKDQKQEPSEVL